MRTSIKAIYGRDEKKPWYVWNHLTPDAEASVADFRRLCAIFVAKRRAVFIFLLTNDLLFISTILGGFFCHLLYVIDIRFFPITLFPDDRLAGRTGPKASMRTVSVLECLLVTMVTHGMSTRCRLEIVLHLSPNLACSPVSHRHCEDCNAKFSRCSTVQDVEVKMGVIYTPPRDMHTTIRSMIGFWSWETQTRLSRNIVHESLSTRRNQVRDRAESQI